MVLSKGRTFSRARKRPMARPKKVRLAIECTPRERRYMKMLAASEDKTLNEFILESVRMRIKKCSKLHTPNAETTQALTDAERGENLIEFSSVEDFFKFLEK